MIYAFRYDPQTLVEFKSQKELDASDGKEINGVVRHYRACGAEAARKWVKNGGHHETGLWFDGIMLHYAPADPEGMQQPRKRRRKR